MNIDINTLKIIEIEYHEAINFLLPRHYSGRKPQITKAFGWKAGDFLAAVCTFGKPAGRSLCTGIMGKAYSSHVYELNRLCRLDELKAPLSKFVAGCLRLLQPNDWIIVSYADTGMNHVGAIYQATNFLYTGITDIHLDPYKKGCHHRHANNNIKHIRQVRTPKHRYVYFCTTDKQLKKLWKLGLKYPIQPYPKGDKVDYVLGDYIKPIVIDLEKNELVF